MILAKTYVMNVGRWGDNPEILFFYHQIFSIILYLYVRTDWKWFVLLPHECISYVWISSGFSKGRGNIVRFSLDFLLVCNGVKCSFLPCYQDKMYLSNCVLKIINYGFIKYQSYTKYKNNNKTRQKCSQSSYIELCI